MGHSHRCAQAGDSMSFACFLSLDLAPLFWAHGAGEIFWGGEGYRGSGQQDSPCAVLYVTSCSVGLCQPFWQLCQGLSHP